MPKVLFVCSANMCRSPMAEAFFKEMVKQNNIIEEWDVTSAGVWAKNGSLAVEGAINAMKHKGFDLTSHRAKQISENIVGDNDLILVMERNHKEALQSAFPIHAKRIYLLSEMVGLSHDIWDPIGGTPADYEDTAEELEMILKNGFPRIQILVHSAESRMIKE